MTRSAWIAICIAYAIGALGALSAAVVLDHQQAEIEKNQVRSDDLDRRTENLLLLTSGIVCLTSLSDDEQDRAIVIAYATGRKLSEFTLPPLCVQVVKRVRDDFNIEEAP